MQSTVKESNALSRLTNRQLTVLLTEYLTYNVMTELTGALRAVHISCTLLESGEQMRAACALESGDGTPRTEGRRQCCRQ